MSSVVDIIFSFSKKEQKDFSLFLESPLFSPRKKVKLLYGIIIRDNFLLKIREVNKEIIYKELFPEEWKLKGYSDSTMRHSFFELQKCVEKFLVFKKIEKNDSLFEEILRKDIRDRHLDALYVKKLNESEKKLEKSKKLGSEYFLNKYKILLERINFDSMYEEFIVKKNKKLSTNSVDEASYYLISHFIAEFLYLEMGCEKYSNRYDNSYNKSFIKHLYDHINVNGLFALLRKFAYTSEEEILLNLYEKKIDLFAKGKEYPETKKFVMENQHILDQNLRYQFIFELVKYAVDAAPDFFRKETFLLYRYAVEEKISHSESTYFPVDLYWNVLNAGNGYGDLEWTENFLKKYKSALPQIVKNTIYSWGMAKICHTRGNYQKSFEYLNMMDKDFFNLGIWRKILLIKIFYDTNQFEQAEYSIASLSKYLLTSRKVSSLNKDRIKTFLNFVLLLIEKRHKLESNELILLRENLLNQKVDSKLWLLEKIDELEKKNIQ